MRVFRRGVPAVLVILLSVLFLKGSTINVPTGTWQSTANMSVARANAVAVLIPDGRIVLAGGADSTGAPTASAEAFSADGTFSALPAMSIARARHAAIYTMAGDLLVTGGVASGGGFTNTAEAFDSLTNTWHSLSATLLDARAGHTMSQLQNGNVLIAGGENSSGPVAALEIYDITSGQFSFAGTLSTARKGHAAAVLNDGRVLIVGGTTVQPDGTSATLASTEIYDPSTGQVSAGPSLSTPRTDATATTLLDGRVLVLGGSYPEAANGNAPELASAEIFDPVSNTFTPSASHLTTARAGHLAFLLPNNNSVLVVGGTATQPDGTSSPLASAELYTPWTDTFAPTQSMSTARDAATGSTLGNGTYIGLDGMLLLAGGTNQDSSEVYGFATVRTDAQEYVPGVPVVITGSGWIPGETVQLSLVETPNVDSPSPMTAVADANGNIYNNQFSPDANDAGITFVLTAKGSNSQAQVSFKDAAKIGSVTASPSNPPEITAGTSQSYNVTVNRSTAGGSGGNFTANVTVSGLPTGAAENPALSITLTSQQNSNSGTLTITTTTAVAAGSYTVTITATNPAVSGDTQTTTVKLNVKNTATSLMVGAVSGVFGGTASLSATLKDVSNNPIQNKSITFTLNGSSVGSAPTNASGIATLSNVSLSGISVGTHAGNIGASFAGDSSYSASSGTADLTVNQATQTLSWTTAPPATATYNTSFSVTATATSGLTPTYNATGSCSIAGNTVTMNSGIGTCTVTADQAGNTNYGAATQLSASVTAQKADQTITVTTSSPASAVYNTQFTVAATASSSLTVSYTSAGVCSNTVATFTMTSGTGTCTVKYDQAGDNNYNAAPQVTASVTAEKANQAALTLVSSSPLTYNQNETLSVTGGTTSGTVTYNLVAGPCAIVGSQLTANSGTGSCSVTATMAGNNNYNDVTSTPANTVTLQKADQTITVTNPAPANAVYNTQFTVAATASSSLPVSYASAGVCSNTGATYTLTSGTGTCTVKFDQAGDSNYNAAPEVTSSVTAQKANQTITVTTPSPASAVYNTQFTVAATASSSLSVSYASAGVCSNTVATYTMTSGTGTCTVKYDQAGDNNYNAAPEVSATVTAEKADQTITVVTTSPANAVYNTQFTVAATASSSLSVSYASAGVCANTGATYTMTSGTGTCTVKYDQAGDNNYNAAPEVTASVAAQKADQTITVGTHAPPTAVYNTSFDVAATANSGLAITYTSTGVCTTPGPHYTMTSGTGTCNVKYDQVGNDNYNAATEVIENVTAQKANQAALTLNATSPLTFDQSETLSVTGGTTGGAVTYNLVSGSCTLVGNQLTANSGIGSCSVTATMAGNDNYNDVISNPANTVTLQKANQARLTLNSSSPLTYSQSEALSVTGGTTGGAVTYSLVSGSCTILGSQLTANSGIGSCSVTATMAGNDNYNDVTSSPANVVNLQKANQATLTLNSTSPLTYSQSEALSVTGGTTGGAVTYNLVSGSCTLVGSQLTANSGIGSCSVTGTMAGNDNYNDVTSSPANVVNLQKANQAITVTTPAPASAVYNTNFAVAATASSSLTVSYTSAGVCSNAGATYTMTSGTGNCTVKFDQAGNDNYNAAPELTESVAAQKANLTISPNSPASIVLHQPTTSLSGTVTNSVSAPVAGLNISISLNGATQSAAADSSGTFSSSFNTGSLAISAGYPVSYSFAGDANFNPAGPVNRSLAVTFGTAVGFFQPWAPAPGAAFKAGSTIPLKWQWTDFNGNVVDSSNVVPFVQSNAFCASSATSDVITLDTAGSSGYQYDPTTFTWQFNWKTAKNAAGLCYLLNVGYNNGPANGFTANKPTQLK